KFAPGIPVIGLALVCVLAPLVNYRPVFQPPTRIDSLPENAIALNDFSYQSGVEIGAYVIHPARDELTLYMRSERRTDEPLFVQILALDEVGRVLERCGLIAGNAMWTTLDWRSDEWVEQNFPLDSLQNASQLEIRFYYLMNDHIFVNTYAPNRPDLPLNTGRIVLQ
ncbi:MAG TPA: hypothetical protein VJZ27_20695, partial [Aggregatilineales bacterium]|nr:hypothetical protein [Aggregatilineales bacterium]